MTWTGARKARLPKNWSIIRRRILVRDPICRACGSMPSTDVDHAIRGDDHSMTNLQGLCTACHRAKSSAEGNAAKLRRWREPDGHPGLVR
ncbi:MAG: HNH endonuclease [Nocardioidaceae bacterium]